MTKVLLITNTTDFTCDYVVRSLSRLGADYYRLNTDEIGSLVFLTFDFTHGSFTLYDRPKGLVIDLKSFSSVYFRRPELPKITEKELSPNEKQFIQLEFRQTLEGLYKVLRNAYWFSDVDAIRRAENKIYQQLLAKEIGLKTPKGIITNHPDDFTAFVRNSESDIIVKPIYSGQIGWPDMQEVVFTSKLKKLPQTQQIELSPSYLQEQISKQYDVRVTVVGEVIFAARIDSQSNPETRTDWRVGENILPHKAIILPDAINSKCKELLRRLNLQFGAIDFIEDSDGDYIFLEINPNGQWAWIETQTGMPISDTIAKYLTNEHLSQNNRFHISFNAGRKTI